MKFIVYRRGVGLKNVEKHPGVKGLTHDNADYLASENNGLVGLIQKKN